MNKKIVSLGLAAVAIVGLAACGRRSSNSSNSSNGASSSTDVRVAMVTDTGGINDKSFNQSAWEGLQAWGKEHNLEQKKGYDYYQSNDESQYETNLESAFTGKYNLIVGIGYNLHEAVAAAADRHTDIHYAIVDEVISGKENVASLTFADNEAAYLAGIAAAKTTKTNKVGFVGGMKGDVITRFETGFKEGVKSVNPDIQVDVQYVESYSDAAKAKTIASTMYSAGADVIFHASGGSGNGVFKEANDRNSALNADDAKKVWVIGVDRDQSAEGKYTSKDGKESSSTLTSTIKEVGNAIKELANREKFPGGEVIRYGLKDGGVDLVTEGLNEDTLKAVNDAKEKIKDGSLTVKDGVDTK
ncbi:BMP family lipoprotein [Streptococcus sp. DD13]|uniref:BMP family lipoprotein n=1 Tax=Streptococcus sp. DD13 TaxID=1777881 RepID=UPI0007954D6D|nr:BMP family protein [Streptococcus sp. DD13]KXT78692.1 Nucleoside-binding protein [Streptococcus sp. DD13]